MKVIGVKFFETQCTYIHTYMYTPIRVGHTYTNL